MKNLNELLYKLGKNNKTDSSNYKIKECPFCNSVDWKFYINIDKECYICHHGSCGQTGTFTNLCNHLGIKKEHEGVKKMELNIKMQSYKKDNQYYNKTYKKIVEGTKQAEYLKTRGIGQDTINYFDLQFLANSIMIPLIDNNLLKCYKVRHLNPINGMKETFLKKEDVVKNSVNYDTKKDNYEKPFFGLNKCDTTRELIIAEGIIDALTIYESGYTNVCSPPNGTNCQKLIDIYYEDFKKFPSFLIIGDNDEAGRKFNKEVSTRLGVEKCRFVEYWENINDTNELFTKHGKQAVIDLIENSTIVSGLLDVAEIDLSELTLEDTTLTGITFLDKVLKGFLNGCLTVLTGRRGSGKSTLIGQIIGDMVMTQKDKTFCVYSGELSPQLYKSWLYKQIAGVKGQELRKCAITGDEEYKIKKDVVIDIDEIIRGRLFLYDNKIGNGDEQNSVIELFKRCYMRYGTKMFFIDNLMSLSSEYGNEKDLYRAQGNFVGKIKKFCNDYNVHVVLCAHPRKSENNVNKDLTNDDVAGSSQITDYADNVISVRRITDEDKQSDESLESVDTAIAISKNRLFGKLAKVQYIFNQTCKRFIEKDRQNEKIKEYLLIK